ncbi:HET-domain-containing protein, partial [Acephala macrosclerotiorum]
MPPDHSLKSLPEDFRLIDVDEYRIVQPKKHVEYCALSYVWGDKEQPLLKSLNKDKAEVRDFLTGLDLPLPRTILDAITLCRGIGCHYLWVDSLCIVQDCKENKHSQISSMADIYSLSYLTIIAAAGEDSSTGLAPYEIEKSAWALRGWTLQEYALSRRVLFFTGSYAFLRC